MNHPQQRGQLKSYKQKQIGQALIEFSLILPLLLVIVLGILDFGRILLIYSNAAGSARDAARQATLVGAFNDPRTGPGPRYRACENIETIADSYFGSNGSTNSIDILYFDTSGTTPLATVEANLDALDSDNVATLDGADYDCNDGSNVSVGTIPARDRNPDIVSGAINSGDLMVVLIDVDVRVHYTFPRITGCLL